MNTEQRPLVTITTRERKNHNIIWNMYFNKKAGELLGEWDDLLKNKCIEYRFNPESRLIILQRSYYNQHLAFKLNIRKHGWSASLNISPIAKEFVNCFKKADKARYALQVEKVIGIGVCFYVDLKKVIKNA